MNASQDVSFCVPVYSQAESASDSQLRDHSGRQDQEVSGGLVPVFCPSWRDKPQTGLEKRKEESPYNVSLVSSLPLGLMEDKRLGSGHTSADVRPVLRKPGPRYAVLPCFAHRKHVLCNTRRNVKPAETPWSVVANLTTKQT